MRLKDLFGVVKEAALSWYDDRTFELGAALAYYAVFSIAPLVIIAIDIAGLLFGEEQARAHLVRQINSATGSQVGGAIAETLKYVHESHSGGWATVFSTVTLNGLLARSRFLPHSRKPALPVATPRACWM